MKISKTTEHTECTENTSEKIINYKISLCSLWLIVFFGLILSSAITANATPYHDLEKNRQPCSDCHTQHYSEGGGTPPGVEAGGPFAELLIRATTNKLCLFCHDGSDPKAPDVLGPVTMYDGSGDEHSGAGFFSNSGGVSAEQGHDLGVTSVSVPFSSMTNMTLTCASCHDPHGTINYRNVLSSPAGGAGLTVEMAKDVFRDAPPGDPPSATASVSAYKESNEGYKANTSLWCTECHDGLKPSVNNPVNRVHHLIDVPVNGGGYPTDPAHWAAGTGPGFGAATGDLTEGVPRLRFQASTATDYISSKVVASGNEVICTSCHLAHGGRYKKGLVWPYLEPDSPIDANSGCNQCHNF
ncbi:MAG: hypothetical protein C4526_08895 [Nitrospiraceae bacterium]|nr:MAG: hypothetical protein C4526_08895 [Nitrospiraceae bacterium]